MLAPALARARARRVRSPCEPGSAGDRADPPRSPVMVRFTRSHLVLALVFSTGAWGCAHRGTVDDATPAGDRSSNAELEALYRARTDSARMRFTEADVQFMTGMIAHHAQALVMAQMAPSHDAGPAIRTLTARIINAQRDEIRTMQSWLRDRGRPVPRVEIHGTDMTLKGVEDPGRMDGMLTPDQMKDLDAARSAEFDRLFLLYMIQHHSGALTMAQDLFASPGAGQEMLAFKIASDIQADQRTEIARMRRMLAAMESPPGGP